MRCVKECQCLARPTRDSLIDTARGVRVNINHPCVYVDHEILRDTGTSVYGRFRLQVVVEGGVGYLDDQSDVFGARFVRWYCRDRFVEQDDIRFWKIDRCFVRGDADARP